MRLVAARAVAGLLACSLQSLRAEATPAATTRIVYRTVRLTAPQRPPQLYSVLPSGRGRRLLALAEDQPAWSPNRRRIALAGTG